MQFLLNFHLKRLILNLLPQPPDHPLCSSLHILDNCLNIVSLFIEKNILSRYIVLVSGLELSGGNCASLSALEMAVAWIVGDTGEMSDQVRLIKNLQTDHQLYCSCWMQKRSVEQKHQSDTIWLFSELYWLKCQRANLWYSLTIQRELAKRLYITLVIFDRLLTRE